MEPIRIKKEEMISLFFFLYYISGPAAKKDICTDENPILVSTSGSENFGFSFTRNSWIQDFGSSAAQGGFTRTLDFGVQRWGLA